MKLTTEQVRQLIKEELSNVLETKQGLPLAGFDEDPEIQEEFMKELDLEGLTEIILGSIFENLLEEYKEELGYLKHLPNPKDRMEEFGQILEMHEFGEVFMVASKAVSNSKAFSGWTKKDYRSMYGTHPAGSVTKQFAHQADMSVLAAKVEEMILSNQYVKEDISLIKPFLLDLVGDKITSDGRVYSIDLIRTPEHLSQAFELWRSLTGK